MLKCADTHTSEYSVIQTGANTRNRTYLDMASKGVVVVKLAHVISVAGVFHFSVYENVSGEQSHLSTHVDCIDDLSNMVILRPP